MAEFTILRINECNKMIYQAARGPKRWLLFWTAAVVLLFLNLGNCSVISGEIPWMNGAAEIMQSVCGKDSGAAENGSHGGGIFALRYWFTVLPSLFTGKIDEFSCRVFSALHGIMLLGCAVSISRNLFGEKTAFLSGWLLLTTLSFGFYSRMAVMMMLGGAWSMAAVAWWIHCRDRKSPWDCFVFFALCSMGALYGGFWVWFFPCLSILIVCFLTRQWKITGKKSCMAGSVAGILLYGIPGLLESGFFIRGHYGESAFATGLTEIWLKYGKQFLWPGSDLIPFTGQNSRIPELFLFFCPWILLFLLLLFFFFKGLKKTECLWQKWLAGMIV